MDRKGILPALGRRLREARERTGMNVTELAERAGVSRRYVTDAEAGRANLSVLKLAALAAALEMTPSDLLVLPSRPAERVALVGLRGAGKSSVGPRLALALEAPFVELDARVERLAGMKLGEIFALHGEEGFHRFERDALEQVLAEGERLVIATGGSIVESEETFARLRATCRTVWLKAEPEDHFARVLEQGDRRPMQNRPRAMAELVALLKAREPAYARCEIAVETSGLGIDEVVADALARLERG